MSIDALVRAASLILFNHSEGAEDSAEWRDLADALLDVTTSAKCLGSTRDTVERRLEDFNDRLSLLESRIRMAEIS